MILSTPGEEFFYNSIHYPPRCSEGEGKECIRETREEGPGKEASGEGGGKRQDEVQEEQQGHNCM